MQEKRAREQFAQYVNAIFGTEAPATPMPAPSAVYPSVRDAGEPVDGPLKDMRPAREQFTGWMAMQMQFDPFKEPGGWSCSL